MPSGVLAGYTVSQNVQNYHIFFQIKNYASQDRDSAYLSIHWIAYLLLCTRITKLIYIWQLTDSKKNFVS